MGPRFFPHIGFLVGRLLYTQLEFGLSQIPCTRGDPFRNRSGFRAGRSSERKNLMKKGAGGRDKQLQRRCGTSGIPGIVTMEPALFFSDIVAK